MPAGRPPGSRKKRPVMPCHVGTFLAPQSPTALYASGCGRSSIFGRAVLELEGTFSKAAAQLYHRWWHSNSGDIQVIHKAARQAICGLRSSTPATDGRSDGSWSASSVTVEIPTSHDKGSLPHVKGKGPKPNQSATPQGPRQEPRQPTQLVAPSQPLLPTQPMEPSEHVPSHSDVLDLQPSTCPLCSKGIVADSTECERCKKRVHDVHGCSTIAATSADGFVLSRLCVQCLLNLKPGANLGDLLESEALLAPRGNARIRTLVVMPEDAERTSDQLRSGTATCRASAKISNHGVVMVQMHNPQQNLDFVFPNVLLEEPLEKQRNRINKEVRKMLHEIDLNFGTDVQCKESYSLAGHPGIQNLGKTCYLNSILQFMYLANEIREPILSMSEDVRSVAVDPYEKLSVNVTLALKAFFMSMQLKAPRPTILARVILEALGCTSFDENDAQEALVKILQHISAALQLSGQSLTCLKGKLRSTLTCTNKACGQWRDKDEEAWDLSLHIQSGHLTAALLDFCKQETLSEKDVVLCSCKHAMAKSLKPCELPLILMIHLKRFICSSTTQTAEKLIDRFDFPMVLFSEDFQSAGVDQAPDYELEGVAVHQGTPSQGHYYYLAKDNVRNTWVKCDDTRVADVSLDSVRHTFGGLDGTQEHPETAYLLVYRQKGKELEANATQGTANDEEMFSPTSESFAQGSFTTSTPAVKKIADSPTAADNIITSSGVLSGPDGAESDDSLAEEEASDSDLRRVRGVERYQEYLGSVEVSKEDFEICYQKEQLQRDLWRKTIRANFQEVESSCPLHFKHSGKPSARLKQRGSDKVTLTIPVYGRCSFPKCRRFRLDFLKTEEGRCFVDVMSTEANTHHKGVRTTHLTGLEREEEVEKLSVTKPSVYQRQCVNEADPNIIITGNSQRIRNDATARTLRKEAVARTYLHKDPVIDALLHWAEEVEKTSPHSMLVQQCGVPLHAYLFCDLQVETVRSQFKDPLDCDIKFDATGRKVGAMSQDPRKKVLLYAAVVNIRGIIIPLFEFIDVRHDQFSIGQALMNFRGFCRRILPNVWPLFGRMAVDCSYALIHAAMRAFNDMRLIDYLKTMYKVVTGQLCSKDLSSIILVTLCRNHFIHMGARAMKEKFGKASPASAFLKEALCAMLQAQTLRHFDEIFRGFLHITLTKFEDEKYSKALQQILALSATVETQEVKSPIEIEIDEHKFEGDVSLLNSPFHTHCYEIYVSVKEELSQNQTGNPNAYYCPEYVTDIFLMRYAPILPLWTEVLRGERGNDYLSSTADVENYFKILDDDVMDHAPDVRLQKYVELVQEYIHATLKKLNLQIETKPRPKSKSKRRTYLSSRVVKAARSSEVVADEDDPSVKHGSLAVHPGDQKNVEEGWSKRTKNPQSHLHLSNIRRQLQTRQETKSTTITTLKSTVPPQEILEHGLQHPWRHMLPSASVAIVDELLKKQNKDPILYLYGSEDRPLYLSSIMALLNNEKLDTSLVDACLYILRKESLTFGLYLASSTASDFIFNADVSEKRVVSSIDLEGVRSMVFPLLKDDHWSVILCDLEQLCLSTINFEGDSEELLEAFLRFLDLWNERQTADTTKDVLKWSVLSRPETLQDRCDKVHCGVRMLMFIKLLLDEKPLTTHCEVVVERCGLAQMCLSFKQGTHGEMSVSGDENRLPNGLIDNVDFYVADLDRAYYISILEEYPPVCTSDFSKLLRNEWINGEVMNAILLSCCGNHDDILVISSQNVSLILDGSATTKKDHNIMKLKFAGKTLVMPYHQESNHWTIVLADCRNKTYAYLDPFRPSVEPGKTMPNFLGFLRRRNVIVDEKISSTGWTSRRFEGLPKQVDETNCGIISCRYVEAYVEGTLHSLRAMDCEMLRRAYASNILHGAPYCKHLCIYCGVDEFKKHRKNVACEMVQCSSCKRWAHVAPCLKYLRMSVQAIRSNAFDFLCVLCVANGYLLS